MFVKRINSIILKNNYVILQNWYLTADLYRVSASQKRSVCRIITNFYLFIHTRLQTLNRNFDLD